MNLEIAADLPRKEREFLRHRAEIIQAAETIFSEKGYVPATMEEIAQEAEFAVGTLYKFFKNKADLYAAVVLDKIDLMGEEIRSQIARGTSPKEKVQLCYWARIELFWEYPRFFRLLFNDLRAMIPGSRAGFIEEIMSRYAVFLRELDQLFAEGVEAGQFRGVRASTLTLLFEGMIGAYNERMCKLETPVRERNVEEDLLTLFLEGATTH